MMDEIEKLPVAISKEKIIYPGRRIKTAKEVEAIINLEKDYLLRMNPEYEFVKIANKKHNPDASTTYFLLFKLKGLEVPNQQ